MLLGKRGDINEVFTYKNNFPEEKNIFTSGKKTDSINTEKNYSGSCSGTFGFYGKPQQGKIKILIKYK